MKRVPFFALLLLVMPAVLFAYIGYPCLKTENFTVFYPPGYEERAFKLLEELELIKIPAEVLTGNSQMGVPVVLESAGQYAQGLTNPVYYKISIFNYETGERQWFRTTAMHEYTHLLHLTNSGGVPGLLHFVFGGILCPNLVSPGWLMEGITVHNESQLSPFAGRLNDGEFDAFLGAMLADGKRPDIAKATYPPSEAPFGYAPYLYGGEFFGYLAKKYGAGKFKKLFDSYGSSVLSYLSAVIPFFGIDGTFEEVYGKGTLELWDEWVASLSATHGGFKIDGTRITQSGYFTRHAAFGGRLYYVRQYSEKAGVYDERAIRQVVEYDPAAKTERVIADRTSQIIGKPALYGDNIYYAAEEFGPLYPNKYANGYGYVSALFEHNLATGTERRLACTEMNAFAPDNTGRIIWATAKQKEYGCTVTALDLKTGKKEQLLDSKEFVIYSMDISPDGRCAVSARREKENLSIYMLDLASGRFEPVADSPWLESSPVIAGKKIIFSANYEGTHAIYAYDTDTRKIYAMTSGGYAQEPAFDPASGTLYFTGMNSKGWDIYAKPADYREYELVRYDEPAEPASAFERGRVEKGSYFENLLTLYPKIKIPYVELDASGDFNILSYGVQLIGTDAMEDLLYSAVIKYDGTEQRAGLDLGVSVSMFEFMRGGVQYNSIPGNFYIVAGTSLYDSELGGLYGSQLLLKWYFEDGFAKRTAVAELNATARWTTGSLYAAGSYYYAGPQTGSSRGYNACTALVRLKQYLPTSVLKLEARNVYVSDPGSSLKEAIKGYGDPLPGSWMPAVKASYELPVLQVRSGLWMPNMLIHDIVAKGFCEAAIGDPVVQLSAGAGLHMEMYAFFAAPLDIGVEMVWTKESGWGPEVTVTSPLYQF